MGFVLSKETNLLTSNVDRVTLWQVGFIHQSPLEEQFLEVYQEIQASRAYTNTHRVLRYCCECSYYVARV